MTPQKTQGERQASASAGDAASLRAFQAATSALNQTLTTGASPPAPLAWHRS